MIVVTGDVHGDIPSRFSYRNNPDLRALTESDYVIVAGDFGCPWFNPELGYYDIWNQPGSEKEEHYKLKMLNEKPWTTIVVCGNHENYDLIEDMPHARLGHADVRQCFYDGVLYENIYYVNTPQYMYLQGQKLLLIPGASSHDADIIFDYDDPFIKSKIKQLRKQAERDGWLRDYRIKHVSWWPQEHVDEDAALTLLNRIPGEVDFVITHDIPAVVNQQWKQQGSPGRLISTKDQEALQKVYDKIKFKLWIHGHLHEWLHLEHFSTLGLFKNFIVLEPNPYNDMEVSGLWQKFSWL